MYCISLDDRSVLTLGGIQELYQLLRELGYPNAVYIEFKYPEQDGAELYGASGIFVPGKGMSDEHLSVLKKEKFILIEV